MEIVYKSIKNLKEWAKNPQLHNENGIQKSIERFGFRAPIIIQKGTNRIIAGHGRVKAMRALGKDKVPCIEWEVVDENEMVAYGIADNALTMFPGMDDEVLGELVRQLDADMPDLDLDVLGLDPCHLDDLLNVDEDGEPSDGDGWSPDDEVESTVMRGELWKLGGHTLMCGDSTRGEDVGILMAGAKSVMVFTDPPWNVGIGGDGNPRHKQRPELKNDNLDSFDFAQFLHHSVESMARHNIGDTYVVLGASEWPQLDIAMRDGGYHWSATIIWVKNIFVLGRSKYHRRYEPIWYGWHKNGKSSYNGKRDLDDVWEYDRPRVSEEHPTMKPVPLVANAIRNSSTRGDVVLDLFGGSGTTLIACEEMGRICKMMELDPHYCDVIINRWEQHTGLQAKKVQG